jgi:hypothetical protein
MSFVFATNCSLPFRGKDTLETEQRARVGVGENIDSPAAC